MIGKRTPVYSDLVLIRDGKAEASIVLASEADPKARAAADDLQNILHTMTGATLPIVDDEAPTEGPLLLVGGSRRTAELGLTKPAGYPGEERVLVRRLGNCIVLMGNDDGPYNGTAFAVTALLERLGCGWFGPDELWQVIPRTDTVSVGYLEIDHVPSFTTRKTWVLLRNPELARRWYMGGEEKEIDHAYWKLFPREQYFQKHPEWYCLVDGRRNPYVEWWQMCYSNEEVQRLTAEKLDRYFREHPYCTQAALSANDGYFEGFCECEDCRRLGTPSEVMIYFVNRIAERLEKEWPDKQLMFFVYFPTYDPPRRKMPLHKNVMLMFCKESCMCHPVDSGPDCGYHVRYRYEFGHNHYDLPWLENARRWIEMTDCRNISVWDWYCPAAANPVWKDIPWVQGDLATRNQRCFRELGAQYVYYDQGPAEAFNDTESSYPLRWPLWYVGAYGMWDNRPTATQILSDACQKLFGAAADAMLSYYLCLADINGRCNAKAIAWHMPEPQEMYTPEAVARVDRAAAAIRSLCGELSGNELRRVENQLALWEKAKAVIQNYPSGDGGPAAH